MRMSDWSSDVCSSDLIFNAIDGAMANAVATTLSLDAEAADALRTRYWKRYGATVIGMVRHHGVDATAFLKLSHDFQVAPLVHAETGLEIGRASGRERGCQDV